MTESRKLRVFLCHSSQDKPIVRELYQRLLAEGWIDPWLDIAKLLPGQHWTSVIRESLDRADLVIVFISKSSIDKEGFVQREMNYAWERSLEKPRSTIYLIPIRLEECNVPYDLRDRQWADYFGSKREETYKALLQSLRFRYDQKLNLEADENKQVEPERMIAKENIVIDVEKQNQEKKEDEKHKIAAEKFKADVKERLRKEHPARTQQPVDNSNKINPKGIVLLSTFSGMSSILGSLLGIVSYFLPWDADRSGFELSFYQGQYPYAYSPAFLLFPATFLLILTLFFYFNKKRNTWRNLGLFLFDCGSILFISLLAHMPWAISIGMFFRSGVGLWGEWVSILLIIASGIYRLFKYNLQGVSQMLKFLKRRAVIYLLLFFVASLFVYYADDISNLLF